jgi:predicted nicotinamide N-methyase
MILCHDFEEELDVLLKNQAGRSILTEGFSSKNTKLVGMLLEHDSATEDKLLQGGKEVDEDEDDDMKGEKPKKESITHEFDFLRDTTEEGKIDTPVESKKGNSILGDGEERKTLLIRELPIENADNPFDEGEDKLDTTGLCIWAASLVMARWMASKAILGRFDGKNVLELGAGCGVPGLALAQYSDASLVYITDYNPVTMDNLKYNIDINANRPCTQSRAGDWLERVKAASIDWSDESTWPKEKMDYIIGSDLIYQKSIVPLLKKVVNGLMKDDGRFLYTCPSDGRDGLVEFISSMKKEGFRCISEEIAPPLYTSNPLSDGDDDDVILHFYELPITEYKLFEFKKE